MKFLISIFLIMIFNANLTASELVEPTRQLNGINITYNYTSGRSYNVKFEEDGISYRYLTGTKPKKWWGPFPYKAFNLAKNIYLASWFEQGYGDYVTLYLDFNNNSIYGSAILSGKDVHFHGAKIIKSNRK